MWRSFLPFPEIPVKCLMRLQFYVLIKRNPLMTFVNVDKHYLKGAMNIEAGTIPVGVSPWKRGVGLRHSLLRTSGTQAEDQHLGSD